MNQQDKERLRELAWKSIRGPDDYSEYGAAILALLEENERLAKQILALQLDGEHSHQCTACAHPYTPSDDAATEDCPQCGWNGVDGYNPAAMAKQGEK